MNQGLLTDTIKLLEANKGRWREISRDTGLGYDWINKLAQGCIADPGVRKIQKLHDHLTNSTQAVA